MHPQSSNSFVRVPSVKIQIVKQRINAKPRLIEAGWTIRYDDGFIIGDPFKEGATVTKYRFAFLPKRCYATKALIWLRRAYQVKSKIPLWTLTSDSEAGPSEERWYTPTAYVKARLLEELK